MLPHAFSKGERDLRISRLAKKKEVKENEKVCAQDEGKTPKFQSSLILLHLVWESCTNKKRMKGRRIKAQLCLSEYFQYVLNEKPPVFHDGSLKGEGNRSSCHLLGMYSLISLRAFKTLGQACVWGNPTATMYKDVKNIILRNERAQETQINFWQLQQNRNMQTPCQGLLLCHTTGQRRTAKADVFSGFMVQGTTLHNAVFIMYLYQIMVNVSDLET